MPGSGSGVCRCWIRAWRRCAGADVIVVGFEGVREGRKGCLSWRVRTMKVRVVVSRERDVGEDGQWKVSCGEGCGGGAAEAHALSRATVGRMRRGRFDRRSVRT